MSGTTIEQIPGSVPAAGAVPASDEQLVAMLVDRARSGVLPLTGEGELLQQLTKWVLESALVRSGLQAGVTQVVRALVAVHRTTWRTMCVRT